MITEILPPINKLVTMSDKAVAVFCFSYGSTAPLRVPRPPHFEVA
jgi:hypothetical protein